VMRATSGSAAAALILAGVTVWGTGCSAPSSSRSASASAAASATSTDPAAACFGAIPQAWATRFSARQVSSATVDFGVGAEADGLAFGQYKKGQAQGIGEIDLGTGRLNVISTYAGHVSGLGTISVDLPWVVWEQADSTNDPSRWSVRAWNRDTRTSRVLATSDLPDGRRVTGQQPMPVIRGGVAAWAQPVSGAGKTPVAEIRLVDLKTGHRSALASGRVSSPVYAGSYLLWARATAAGQGFTAVNASTRRPAVLPAQLRAPGTVGQLAGSARYLVWSSGDSTTLTVVELDKGEVRRYHSGDGRHYFQFMQLAGGVLTWFSSANSSVMDLGTGSAFDLPGTVAAGTDSIVSAQLDGAAGSTRLYSVPATAPPPIPRCS
jgi:hypothetical protein